MRCIRNKRCKQIHYAAATNALRHASPPKRRPMIVVASLENRTTQRVQGRLDAARDTISASLYNSGFFELISLGDNAFEMRYSDLSALAKNWAVVGTATTEYLKGGVLLAKTTLHAGALPLRRPNVIRRWYSRAREDA